jgi:hypothetical protein
MMMMCSRKIKRLMLVVMVLMLAASPVLADVLVTNIGESPDGGWSMSDEFRFGTGFKTDDSFYLLTAVTFVLTPVADGSDGEALVHIYRAHPVHGWPDLLVGTMADPDVLPLGVQSSYTFRADTGIELVPIQNYYAIIETADASRVVELALTNSENWAGPGILWSSTYYQHLGQPWAQDTSLMPLVEIEVDGEVASESLSWSSVKALFR